MENKPFICETEILWSIFVSILYFQTLKIDVSTTLQLTDA